MKAFLVACALALCLAHPPAAQTEPDASQQHLVFAHYMPCFHAFGLNPADTYWWSAQYNPSEQKSGLTARPIVAVSGQGDADLEATVADVRLAKSYGIDGFLVDELDDGGGYSPTWQRLLKAAEMVGGFKIGLMPDYATLPSTDPKDPSRIPRREKILHWLKLAENSPALLRVHDRPVVMPYGVGFPDAEHSDYDKTLTGPEGEKKYVVDWLAAQGMPVSFAATHGLDWKLYEQPYAHDPVTGYQTFAFATGSFSPVTDDKYQERALTYWPPSLMQMGENSFVYYNRGWRYAAGGDLSTYYRHRWEWDIAHRDRLHWIMLVTWNDWGETALAPSPNHLMAWQPLTRYYADWFKTGRKPVVARDVLTLFHRPHPFAAKPSPTTFEMSGQIETPRDVVEAVALLSRPATLVLVTGGHVSRRQVGAGVQSFVVPFALGVQAARIERGGKVVANVTTAIPVTDHPARQNLWFVGADSAHPPRPLVSHKAVQTVTDLSLFGDALQMGDCSVSAHVLPGGGSTSAGIAAHLTDGGKNGYRLTLNKTADGGQWRLEKWDKGTATTLDSGAAAYAAHSLRLDCVGEYRMAYLDGKLVSEVSDYPSYPNSSYLAYGQAGLAAEGAPARFADVQAASYDPDTSALTAGLPMPKP